MDKDFQEEEFNNRKRSSLAEKVYSAFSKKLIEGEAVDAYGTNREVDKNKINSFLPILDNIIEKYPDYKYLPYYKAQMLLAIGDKESGLDAFLPFAKQKQNDFWVWGLMAEIFEDDKDLQFACYCKALSLRTPNDFLIKTRQAFVKPLIERELYTEAKAEIKNIINVRKSKEWKIPNEIVQWTESNWYTEANEISNNKSLYEKHKRKAEELLYSDIPEQFIVVEFVNYNKNMLSFVKDKTLNGFFNYEGLINNPKIGDVLKVRVDAVGNEGFHRALTLDVVDKSLDVDIPSLKEVSGVIRIPENKSFGFIDGIFIPPNLVKSSNLVSGQEVAAKAILSFNKSKNEWSWKGIEIIK